MKELENIDDMFKSAFEGFAVTPEASVKSVIDESLFAKKDRLKIGFWLFFIGSMVGLITFVFGAILSPLPSQKYSQNRIATSENLIHIDVDSNFYLNDVHLDKISTPKRSLKNNGNTYKIETSDFITETKLINPTNKKKTLINATENSHLNKSIFENKLIEGLKPLRKNQFLDVDLLEIKRATSFNQERSTYLDLVSFSKNSIFKSLDEKSKESRMKQSLTALVSYGFESTTSEKKQLKYEQLENGEIQFRTTELILEYRRNISNSFALNLGFGYAHHNVLQKGRITMWDSIPEDITVSIPNSFIYDSTQTSDNINYRFQQIHLGIGLSYAYTLLENWNLDLSAGSEFRIGKLKNRNEDSIFEVPEISPFGISIYLRPAVEYKIGKYSLLAFGQVNKNIVSQLSWSFIDARNPRFGGGIAIRYNF